MKNKIIALSVTEKPELLENFLDAIAKIPLVKSFQESPSLPFEAEIYKLLFIRSFKRLIPTRNIYNIGDVSARELIKNKELALTKLNYIIQKTKRHELIHLSFLTIFAGIIPEITNMDSFQRTLIYTFMFFTSLMSVMLQRTTRQRMNEFIALMEGNRQKNPNVEKLKQVTGTISRLITDESSGVLLPH